MGLKKEKKKHEEASGAGTAKGTLFKQGPLDKIRETLQSSEFLGYETETADALVMGLLVNDELSYKLDRSDSEFEAAIVLDRTPFYGEMGGQVGDTGWITGPNGRFEVTDTRVEDDFILHVGHLREGRIEYKDTVQAAVDSPRRQAIRRAHSATHLLQYALQKTLGKQTHQKGSKVEADLLRFDFNYDQALSPEQLATIETEVNARVFEAVPVQWTLMPKEEAQKLGAMMLFGEKYPDTVRVVSMGEYSKELCGGTHLENTAADGLREDRRRGEHRQGHPPHHRLDGHGGRRPRTARRGPAAADRGHAPRGGGRPARSRRDAGQAGPRVAEEGDPRRRRRTA